MTITMYDLAGSEAAFATGTLQLFQVVFAPSETAAPHWTRAGIYNRATSDQWLLTTR